MPTATTTYRSRAAAGLVVALVASLLAILVPVPAEAAVDGNAEAQFVSLLNQERAARGLPRLAVASDLVAVARQHSARMASADDLHHNPNLGSDVSGWQKVGENVGRGGSVGAIHDAFMASSGHRANILDPDWSEVGIGVEVVDGRVWVTEVMRQPARSAAPDPPPAPKASTKTAAASPPRDATPAAAPAEPREAAPDRTPLPALQDRTMAVLARIESA